jgi:ubiquinone/menaquinone biosynthesis C-methylase UbiE
MVSNVSSQNQDNQSSSSNQDEYSDPLTYDQEYGSYEPSGSFYRSLALEVGSPILELACGTGRVTIPLANQGLDVTGIDISEKMLDRASQKSGDLAITWIQADCRSFNVQKKFRLIYMTGNSFQAFLTREDQE